MKKMVFFLFGLCCFILGTVAQEHKDTSQKHSKAQVQKAVSQKKEKKFNSSAIHTIKKTTSKRAGQTAEKKVSLTKDSTSLITQKSTAKKPLQKDSLHLIKKPNIQTVRTGTVDRWRKMLGSIKGLPLLKKGVFVIEQRRIAEDRTPLFYLVLGLLGLYGFVISGFNKYYHQLWSALVNPFQRNLLSEDTKGQNNLPSLFLNILFAISVSLCVSLVLSYKGIDNYNIYVSWIVLTAFLLLMYLVRFLLMTTLGWIFDVDAEAIQYNKIIFLISKIIGVVVLPLSLFLAFNPHMAYLNVIMSATGTLVVLLLLYRYVVCMTLVGKNMSGNVFQFFIYLCCVEILPLLILYKLLFVDNLFFR